MPKVAKYGVLSTAQITRNGHIPGAEQSDNSQVIALSSRSLEKAEAVAKRLSVPRAYGSYQELLTDPEIDAVINTLPNSLHCEWTVKAAEAGKHILCEKPIAETTEDTQRMIDAAAANGVLLTEAFTHRLMPALRYASQKIQSGELGTALQARVELTYTLNDWESDVRAQSELSGGSLMDCGCYGISALRYLLGVEPLSVSGYENVNPEHGVDDHFYGLLRFGQDCSASLFSSFNAPFRASIEITFMSSRLLILNFFKAEKIIIEGKETQIMSFDNINRFTNQITIFSKNILNNIPLEFPATDALINTKIMAALKHAAKSNQAIALNL